jgi:hypothetical protein
MLAVTQAIGEDLLFRPIGNAAEGRVVIRERNILDAAILRIEVEGIDAGHVIGARDTPALEALDAQSNDDDFHVA